MEIPNFRPIIVYKITSDCLLYTSDAADEL